MNWFLEFMIMAATLVTVMTIAFGICCAIHDKLTQTKSKENK